jgi:hypothetical protein
MNQVSQTVQPKSSHSAARKTRPQDWTTFLQKTREKYEPADAEWDAYCAEVWCLRQANGL